MNRILLVDTHIFLWFVLGIKPASHVNKILDNADELLIPSVCLLEVKIKQNAGKLVQFNIEKFVREMQLTVLPFNEKHVMEYSIYDKKNKDPFDNAIIAVAISEKKPLITADEAILQLSVPGLKVINARK